MTCDRLKLIAIWVVLLGMGLMQMTGDIVQVPALKGIGAASAMSPAPKVFSAVRGFETYSTRFHLQWHDHEGNLLSHELTPALNAHIHGPYNRRNVFGAVIAYGPVLPLSLRDPVMRYAVCGEAPLLRELGFDPAQVATHVSIRYEPVPGTDMHDLPRRLEAPCP